MFEVQIDGASKIALYKHFAGEDCVELSLEEIDNIPVVQFRIFGTTLSRNALERCLDLVLKKGGKRFKFARMDIFETIPFSKVVLHFAQSGC